MKLLKKDTSTVLFELALMLFFFLYIFLIDCSSFVDFARVSTVCLFVDLLLFCYVQKKIMTIQTLFILLFVLFQFGLPIVYAINPEHFSFYINLFVDDLLLNALKYTVIATQLYIIVSTIVVSKNNQNERSAKNSKFTNIVLNNSKRVASAALILFFATAVVSLPVNLFSCFRALTSGGLIGNAYRGTMSANGLTRFCQEFFFSSGLLFLCFSKKKFLRRIVSTIYIIVAISMILVADRSGGVTAIIVYALYNYYSSGQKKKKFKLIILILVAILLAFVSSTVANLRLGYEVPSGLNLILNVIEEMGFNFTSLCFAMDYIPSKVPFRLGLSYLVSIVLLIPKSFGLKASYPKLQSYLGETWLWNANNLYDRSFLSFGVGFSLIAESYYNFSWWGILTMIPLALIVTNLLKEKKNDNAWSLYVRIVLMLNFFTLPRRQFYSIVKSIEYSIFFMGVYLLIYIGICNIKKCDINLSKKQNYECILKK